MPLIPEKPSPPPSTPRAVGDVTLAAAKVNVSPSAPVPDPMEESKAAEMPTPGTAVGQNADPASFAVAAVSWRLAEVPEVTSDADPLSCHPPAVGDGIVAAAAAVLAITAILAIARPMD